MTSEHVADIDLSDGSTIPQLGFGVWRVGDDEAEQAVGVALQSGYRLVDTAALYGNEAGVGRALAAHGDSSIYLTTKLWNTEQGYDSALAAFDESMTKLGVDVLDLYLIHWPAPARDLYVDTWKAFAHLQSEGRVRSIGVSNFTAAQLTRLIDETGVTPVLNQIELHPYLQQPALTAFHRANGIATEAWSPLGAGDNDLLQDPVLADVATRHEVSPAQVVLAWHLAKGHVVIPKSVTPSRIVENLAAAQVSIPADDLARLDALDRGARTGPDPDELS